MRYRKNKEIVKVLTKEIDVIPNKESYDQLVKRIKDEAVSKGVNKELDDILKEQNLPEKNNWKQNRSIKDEKVAILLGEFLNKCKDLNDPESVKLVNELRREAIQQNVDKELDTILAIKNDKKLVNSN